MATNLLQSRYVLFVGISVLIALLFPVTRHLRQKKQRQQYYLLQGITLLGAVFGAKLSVLIGDHGWPWTPVNDWSSLLHSGRSVTGALICGFLFAELAKPLLKYSMPPNDRFAAVLPFSIATGRLGCLMAGCCQGIPNQGWCAVPGVDGVLRHPAPIYEIIFQLTIGITFILIVKRQRLFGRLFSLYLILYGVFRFLTEFVRDTPKFFHGLSGYQLLSLVMISLGAAFFLKRTFAPPSAWSEFRIISPPQNNNQHSSEASHV